MTSTICKDIEEREDNYKEMEIYCGSQFCTYWGNFPKTSYLVLTHAMAWIQNDPVARHIVVTRWTVVKAIVKHSSILQLEVR